MKYTLTSAQHPNTKHFLVVGKSTSITNRVFGEPVSKSEFGFFFSLRSTLSLAKDALLVSKITKCSYNVVQLNSIN